VLLVSAMPCVRARPASLVGFDVLNYLGRLRTGERSRVPSTYFPGYVVYSVVVPGFPTVPCVLPACHDSPEFLSSAGRFNQRRPSACLPHNALCAANLLKASLGCTKCGGFPPVRALGPKPMPCVRHPAPLRGDVILQQKCELALVKGLREEQFLVDQNHPRGSM